MRAQRDLSSIPRENTSPLTTDALPTLTPSWMGRMSLCPICHLLPLKPPQAPQPSSPNRPCLLIPPNRLNYQSPERVQSSISAIISGLAFCDLFQTATNSGKSRLLDGASPQGPSSWLTRMPKSVRFRFLDSGIDPISARAADLLACPPHLLHKHCLSCSYHTSPALQPLGDDARHFVNCPKGLRLHSTVSDRVRDELAYILERCNIRVIAERPGSHQQMSSFMLREGSSLLKQPDIIIPDLDGPRSFTLIDVKICDPAAPSYAAASAKSAQHRHQTLEAAGPREYFGPSRRPPPGSRMRICTFVVSSFGSLGTQALGLIKDIGRRTNLFVPPALAHETTWATMSITSFLRSAISFQVRKRIAAFLREPLPDDFIPPPPHAVSACGEVNDVDHGDQNGTPSI